MYDIAMKDMALTPTEIKSTMPQAVPENPIAYGGPKYPYGLCISLGTDELKKLKIVDEKGDVELPEVGDMIHLFAMAKVTSVSTNESQDGCNCRVELQITHLGLENEDDENETADDEMTEA